MTFHSKATTPEEFRQELLDYLQHLATQRFNDRRRLERFVNRKRDMHDLATRFQQICEIRDFLTNLRLLGDTP